MSSSKNRSSSDQLGAGAAGALFALLLLLSAVIALVDSLPERERAEVGPAEAVLVHSRDEAVTAKVKAALALSQDVNALDIDVGTRDGRVTLSGEVRSEEGKSLAERIAAHTSGVAEVDNRLAVWTGTTVSE